MCFPICLKPRVSCAIEIQSKKHLSLHQPCSQGLPSALGGLEDETLRARLNLHTKPSFVTNQMKATEHYFRFT